MASSTTMTKSERETFLADLHVGVISIEQGDGPPLSAPIWYDYSPEQGLWVITDEDSLKGKALRAAGRFTLVAQTEEPPSYKYVAVSGPIVEERECDRDKDTRAMAHRYFGPALGDMYVENESSAAGRVYVMRPERWRTVDYAKVLPSG